MKYIVYFRPKEGHPCLMGKGYKFQRKDCEYCYFCPCTCCTKFSDGLIRTECENEKAMELVAQRKREDKIDIIAIIEFDKDIRSKNYGYTVRQKDFVRPRTGGKG